MKKSSVVQKRERSYTVHNKPKLFAPCQKNPKVVCISAENTRLGSCVGCEYHARFYCSNCNRLITPNVKYAFSNRLCSYCGVQN